MAKIVNSWNEWNPLKYVNVGRPKSTNIPAPEPAWRSSIRSGIPLTEEFKKLMKMNDWELIPAAKPVYVHNSRLRSSGI